MKLIWITDVSLQVQHDEVKQAFYEEIKVEAENKSVSAILITGNVADAESLHRELDALHAGTGLDVFFVLGNGDFYGSNIRAVKKSLEEKYSDLQNGVLYLSDTTFNLALSEDRYLVGVDGWCDGLAGTIVETDYNSLDNQYILDLVYAQNLGGDDAFLRKRLELSVIDSKALQAKVDAVIRLEPKEIIIATSVPPFKESCIFNGERLTDNFLPYYCNQNMGDMIMIKASQNPDILFTVYCGRMTEANMFKKATNVIVHTGNSGGLSPVIADIIEH